MTRKSIAVPNECILVTGSNGLIGSKVVEEFLEYGFANLRCFVRPWSNLSRLHNVLATFNVGRNVELFTGDLLSPENCRKAAEGDNEATGSHFRSRAHRVGVAMGLGVCVGLAKL